MFTTKKLLTLVVLLSVITIGSLGFTGYTIYTGRVAAQHEQELREARLQGEISMLNSIYKQAESTGSVVLVNVLPDADGNGEVDRGEELMLVVSP